uniref:Uncharacterized protein n=1 Tax=Meloidogyne hapla TaxID=6305 RepID=A0A1I8BTN4_MELHA
MKNIGNILMRNNQGVKREGAGKSNRKNIMEDNEQLNINPRKFQNNFSHSDEVSSSLTSSNAQRNWNKRNEFATTSSFNYPYQGCRGLPKIRIYLYRNQTQG